MFGREEIVKGFFRRGVVITVALFLLGNMLLVTGSVIADEPPPPRETFGTAEGAQGDVGVSGVPALYRTFQLRGGYVAKGIGMRNRGYGTIVITGVPRGAKVVAAYLYWGVIAKRKTTNLARGVFYGYGITGRHIGTSANPCWGPVGNKWKHYAYRANVTKFIRRRINGRYRLQGFASGRTDGKNPWKTTAKPPLMEGASLVIAFRKSGYPLTKMFIYNGSATTMCGPVLSVSVSGFTATDPVGPVYTTFIGADGQDIVETGSTCRGVSVPEADWDGTDRQDGRNFRHGNLWDTDTASVGKILRPGDTSVQITTTGNAPSSCDCLVWVAQVFSISPGDVDTDGDALLDGWEANGYDDDGDYVVDVDLPTMGADYLHKDIFVEIDWMSSAGDNHHKPNNTVLRNTRRAFEAAPLKNPRGGKGIKIHLDVGQAPYSGGNAIDHQEHLGTCPGDVYNWSAFDTLKSANFDSVRSKIFHYNIFAHDLCPEFGSVSGISRGIPASDFIVSLGSWTSEGTDNARTGTFIHELGHNLGLCHGGNAGDHENYKPNHVSLMNYSFQTIGVWRDSARRWDYTRMTIYALDESNLNEKQGLNGSASLAKYGTRYYCEGTNVTRDDNTANTNVDWNCNGNNRQTSVASDINQSGGRSTLGQVRNQWRNLTYNGGSIGGPGLMVPTQILHTTHELLYQELTYEMFQQMEQNVVQVE